MTLQFERAATGDSPANYDRRPPPAPVQRGLKPANTHAAPLRPAKVIGVTLLCDGAILTAAGIMAAYLDGAIGWPTPMLTLLATTCVALITLTALGLRWAYTVRSLMRTTRQMAETGVWLFAALSALVMLQFLLGQNPERSRNWIALWFALGWPALAVARIVTAGLLKRWAKAGRLVRRTVIAGGGQAAADLIARLEHTARDSIAIAGFFDDRGPERSPQVSGPYEKIGRFEDLADFCRAQAIDLIIVALPPSAEDRIMQLLKKL